MGIIPSVYAGLNIPDAAVPLFDPEDWERYVSKLEEKENEWQKSKNSKSKKAEKFFEISAFFVFSRSDLNRPKDL
ncbi:MAG: hypothetical protein IJY69_01205 [Clostridia bacterium]|nr:hypothetical protein [Clostridia bacterium]